MFGKKKDDVLVQTNKMTADEVIDTYARLNLYQKAGLLRLLVRDVIFEYEDNKLADCNLTTSK